MASKHAAKGVLIASDLDGTLLRDDHTISVRSKDAILRVQQAGAMFCLASGRPSFMLTVYQNAVFNLNTPQISSNGAFVIDPENGSVLHCSYLPHEPALRYIHFCWNEGLDFGIFTEQSVHFVHSPSRKKRYAAYNDLCDNHGQQRVKLNTIHSLAQAQKVLAENVLRISVAHRDENEEKKLLEYFRNNTDNIDLVHSIQEAYDVIPKGVNKWNAIRITARYLGVSPNSIYVFGNDINDIEMLNNAPHSFAVANSISDVQQAAKTIIPSNNNDGVAKTIEALFL